MKILNLVSLEKSDIKYIIQRFPDGQQDIVIDSDLEGDSIKSFWAVPSNKSAFADVKQSYTIKQPTNIVTIKSRFTSFKDLELIVCATKALRRLGVKEIHLYIPYLLGARSDRQFIEGGTSYLVDVVAPLINSLKFESITVMDVHSDVAAACIKNLKVINNVQLVRFAIRDIYKPLTENSTKDGDEYVLISPDAGASKKIYKLAEKIGYKGDVITCSKDRGVDGKLTRTVVPISNRANIENKDLIIIDDICDGGATFINIAKTIKEENTTVKLGKIYLIVTHGIFSAGFEELSKYFDGIYCTDSYKNQFMPGLKNKQGNLLVNQLNVF